MKKLFKHEIKTKNMFQNHWFVEINYSFYKKWWNTIFFWRNIRTIVWKSLGLPMLFFLFFYIWFLYIRRFTIKKEEGMNKVNDGSSLLLVRVKFSMIRPAQICGQFICVCVGLFKVNNDNHRQWFGVNLNCSKFSSIYRKLLQLMPH